MIMCYVPGLPHAQHAGGADIGSVTISGNLMELLVDAITGQMTGWIRKANGVYGSRNNIFCRCRCVFWLGSL